MSGLVRVDVGRVDPSRALRPATGGTSRAGRPTQIGRMDGISVGAHSGITFSGTGDILTPLVPCKSDRVDPDWALHSAIGGTSRASRPTQHRRIDDFSVGTHSGPGIVFSGTGDGDAPRVLCDAMSDPRAPYSASGGTARADRFTQHGRFDDLSVGAHFGPGSPFSGFGDDNTSRVSCDTRPGLRGGDGDFECSSDADELDFVGAAPIDVLGADAADLGLAGGSEAVVMQELLARSDSDDADEAVIGVD